jgi:hypothetical protein
MADTKITALAAITTVDPAADVLPIVDISDTSMAASGTTKKITSNQILQSGGVATLASATITGDLTVDTSTLKVDSTGNAVGIGASSPTANTLTIGASRFILCTDSQSKFGDSGIINGGAADANTQIQYFGGKALIFSEGASNTKMTLNSTGLGVGVASPSYKLEVVAPAGDNIVSLFRSGDATAANNAGGGFRSISSATAANRVAQVWLDADGADFSSGDYFFIQKNGNSGTVEFNQSSNAAMTFLTNGTERARIDASGNLILQSSATPATLGTNGMLTVNATSNTNLRFSYRGSDGTTRVANITLA